MDDLFKLLQIFADGGDGGASGAAPAGASEAAAPASESMESRLEALGVPKDKIRRRSKPTTKAAAPEEAPAAEQPVQQDDAADNQESEESTEAHPTKPSFDELMKDPDYNREMQKIVKDRLKTSKAAEDQLNKLIPALEVLSRHYNVDAKDLDAIAQAVNDDDTMYADKANELGIPTEMAKRMDQLERSEKRHEEEVARTEAENRLAEHLQGLRQQEAELKQTFPNFSLQAELENPVFRRMTAPGSGLSVADAYYAVHRTEIQAAAAQVTAQKVAEKLSNSIQSKAKRPTEAGTSAQAPTVSTFDYTKMSRQQREDLKRRIHEAAARGRKLYPGQ